MDANEYEDIAKLAYRFWEERGRPLGSPEVDWHQAEREVESGRHILMITRQSPYVLEPKSQAFVESVEPR